MSKRGRASRRPAGVQPGGRKTGAMTAVETPASASITKHCFATLLQHATIAYLSLPLVIFLVGYLHFGWAATAAASLFAALWFYFMRPFQSW